MPARPRGRSPIRSARLLPSRAAAKSSAAPDVPVVTSSVTGSAIAPSPAFAVIVCVIEAAGGLGGFSPGLGGARRMYRLRRGGAPRHFGQRARLHEQTRGVETGLERAFRRVAD